MVSIILSIDSLEHVRNALTVLGEQKKFLESQIAELEETPRKKISYESIVLAEKTAVLKSIDQALEELVALTKEINSNFLILTDLEKAISASQPYNAGSRENY
jgi:hypothetical protein